MEVASRLHGVGEYYFSQKLREIDSLNKQGKDVINLGIGSPDLPPHPDVIRVLQEESAKPHTHAYQSYKGSPILRKAISAWYNRWYGVMLDPETEILPLIGSKEGIMHICMTYFGVGDSVLIPDPGYPTYSSVVKLSGATCLMYELSADKAWTPDLDKIAAAVSNSELPVKGMFVNYPHMPTGVVADEELIKKLVQFAADHKLLLIHDNPYSFILNDRPRSFLSYGMNDHVLELNSLSKSHNMAGWRVGMLCASQKRIDEVLRFKSNMDSGMFLPVQLAAAKALELGNDWFDSLNNTYRERRVLVHTLLDTLQCDYSSGQSGLFIWASIPKGHKDAFEFSDHILNSSSVFITPGGIFGKAGESHIRISLCSDAKKISTAVERIKRVK